MFTDIDESLANDPWFKVVEFLQQNWAVVVPDGQLARVVFYGDACDVFDELEYKSVYEAHIALKRNGFSRYQENSKAKEFIALPHGKFRFHEHPNGRIYSSGRFWRD